MQSFSGEVKIYSGMEEIQTNGFCNIKDVTNIVRKYVKDSQINEGQALISVPGATAGITTIEYEPGLLKDLPEFFEKIIPSNISYKHDQTWHDGNGFSHLRAALLKPSLTIPISGNDLVLGTWQQIILIDFDNGPRSRNFFIQIMGIGKNVKSS